MLIRYAVALKIASTDFPYVCTISKAPAVAVSENMMSTTIVPRFQRNAFIWYALILLFSLLVCAPMLWHGALYGHSLHFNLVWLSNFTVQLSQGDLYPRWLMDMNLGAGSPAFYFYAPLPFYIASIPGLILPGIDLTIQLAVGEWLLIALSGFTFFHFARRHFTVLSASLGAMLYMVLPYHFEINLWLRQDVGELANYIWMPLALYYSEKLFDGEDAIAGLAVTYGLLMFSHLPSALLFSIALGCYVLALSCQRRAWRFLPPFAAAIVIGILLAGIYWVPALFSIHYVHIEKMWTPYFDFRLWFFPPDEHLPQMVFKNRLFAVLCSTTTIFVLCWLNAFRERRTIDIALMSRCLALVGVAWFMMSPWSLIVWKTVPELWKVQFPWRIAMVVDLATAIVVIFTLDSIYLHRDKLSTLCATVALSLLLYTSDTYNPRLAGPSAPSPQSLPRFLAVGSDAREYRPRWISDAINFTFLDASRLNYDQGKGRATVIDWKPRKISLDVSLRESTPIAIRQLYFPNWRARIDAGTVLNVQPDAETGLIQFVAPAGNYKLSLQLVPLLQESVGAALSGLALLILIGRFWLQRKFRRASGKYSPPNRSGAAGKPRRA